MVKQKQVNCTTGTTLTCKLIRDGYKTSTHEINVNDLTPSSFSFDAPSTVYNPDVDCNVNTNVAAQPEISFSKNVILPDENVFVTENKFWSFAPVGQTYSRASVSDFDNFTVTGQVYSDGDMTKFDSNSWITIPFDVKDFMTSYSFICKLSIDSSYTYQVAMEIEKDDSQLIRYESGNLGFHHGGSVLTYFSVSNGDIVWVQGVYDGTKYTVYCLKDNNNIYTNETLPELSQWTKSAEKTCDMFNNSSVIYVGTNYNYDPQRWLGGIDMNTLKIYVNDELFWEKKEGKFVKNYTPYGTAVVDENYILTASDSTGSGLDVDLMLNVPSDPWEISFKATIGDTVPNDAYVFLREKSDQKGIRLGIADNNFIWLVSNGSQWMSYNGYQGTYTVQPNTTYFIKAGYDVESDRYYVKYSLDGKTYTTDVSYASVNGGRVNMTCKDRISATNMTQIDLNSFEITVGGRVFWRPLGYKMNKNFLTTGTPFITQGGIGSGFHNSSAYLKLPFKITSNEWEYTTHVLLSSTGNYYHCLLGEYANINFATNLNNNLGVHYDSSHCIYDTSYSLSTNKWYWVKLIYKSGKYSCYSLDRNEYSYYTLPDLSQWRFNFEFVSNDFFKNTDLYLGAYYIGAGSSCALNGQQDLLNTKFVIDGKTISVLEKIEFSTQGILDPSYNDTGSAATMKLYACTDTENKENLLLTNNASYTADNVKHKQYISEVTIPAHTVYSYIDGKWKTE